MKKSCETCKNYIAGTSTCQETSRKYNAWNCGAYEYDPFTLEPETDIPEPRD